MKIHEVERLVGVTRGNIRFYEKEGLLAPGRNSDNGYREYGEADVVWLKKVKLLRMLDVPIEEIRRLKSGELTLEEAMDRHLIQLEHRRTNLDAMSSLCAQLRDRRESLERLDVDAVLAAMEEQEQEGRRFVNVRHSDKVRRYVGPLVGAGLIVALMAWLIVIMLWAFAAVPEGAPPAPLLAVMIALPVVVIVGAVAALIQRFREIERGEEDEARKY